MTRDPSQKRFTVWIDVNGKRSEMVVSTVSCNFVDVRLAKAAGIALGPVINVDAADSAGHVCVLAPGSNRDPTTSVQ